MPAHLSRLAAQYNISAIPFRERKIKLHWLAYYMSVPSNHLFCSFLHLLSGILAIIILEISMAFAPSRGGSSQLVPSCPANGHFLSVLKCFLFTTYRFLSSGFVAPLATVEGCVPPLNGQLYSLPTGVMELMGATFAAH